MVWLYRLQKRLSITRHEGLAVLTLVGLFLLGLAVRHVQEQQTPPVATDSLVVRSAPDSTSASVSESDSGPPVPSAENPIDVNAASLEALQTLPGIGPALSKRIEAYRSSQRPFQRVDELTRVSGIGPKTLETLRPMVQVKAPANPPGHDADPES
jgi:competence protein ComEA